MATLKNKGDLLIAEYKSDKASKPVLSCCVHTAVPGLSGWGLVFVF